MFISKGEIVQHRGELHTKLYLVKKGLLRSYALDHKGKEHVFMFAPEDWLVADNNGPETPCELYIDALEDSEVVVIEKASEYVPDIQKLYNRLGALQHRIVQLLQASALERYEDFINTYPDITQRVPQRMIASYLGMTPEALSKLKNERRGNP